MVRLLQYGDIENAYDHPERVGRLAGAIDRRRGPDAIVLGSGDDTGPGALALATEGEQALDFFQAVQPAAEVLGNHDLDYGPERARALIEASPQDWLAANVRVDGTKFGADVGVAGSTVLERDGTRVGVIGVTDPETPAMCPPAAALEFGDPVEAVREERAALAADVVVVLSHVGRGDARSIARSCAVDAVLGGHVHETSVEWIDGTVCTRPGANGATLLEVDLADGQVTRHDVADAPLATDLAERLRERVTAHGLADVVMRVSEPIERSRATLRAGESAVGNFVADAYRWATGADVGLQNTAGLRTGPPLSGAVTRAELVGLVPFDARIVLTEVSGRRLERILAQGEGERMPGLGDYWHAQISGATVARGDQIAVTVDGDPIDADATYRLATTDFLCRTDAEFPALCEDHVLERGRIQHEAVLEYAEATDAEPTLSGRISQKE